MSDPTATAGSPERRSTPTTAASIPYEGTDCTAEEAVEAVQAVRATAAGCDGRDIRADVATYPEKIGPRCGQPHVIEITRKGWDRPIRLCRKHAERTCLTDAEKMTLNGR